MRIFVTGATGWVGSAIVNDLIVPAIRCSAGSLREGAQALRAAGAAIQRGSLADIASLRSGAAQADAVIHTAFNHDFSTFAANCAEDQRAIEAIGTALEGSARPLLVTSGVAPLAPGRTATEEDAPNSSFPRKSSPRRARWWHAVFAQRACGFPLGPWSWRPWLRAHPDRHRTCEGRVCLCG